MLLINSIGVLIYIASCFYVVKKDKRFLVIFGFLAFTQIWALISCFYNDIGIFNIELSRYTVTTLATFRLSMLYTTFNLGFLAMLVTFRNRPLLKVDFAITQEPLKFGIFKMAVYGAVGLIIVFIAYKFYTEGIPVLSGFHKLSYFEETNFLERTLRLYGFLFVFILGYYQINRGRLSVNGILLSLFIVYLLLTGNKFSTLLLFVVCYSTPVFVWHYVKNPRLNIFKARYFIIGTVIVVLLISFAFASYSYVSDDTAFASFYLTNRVLAFQGEMWWAIDYDYYNAGIYDPVHWKTEFDAVISPEDVPSTDVGMKYLMIAVLGPEKAFMIFEKGYLYTMTYPGILIATFPMWTAYVIQFFAGIMFFMILYYLHYSIEYKHFLRAVITMLIMLPFIIVLFTGNFGVFFTFGLIIKVSVLLLLEIIGAQRSTH